MSTRPINLALTAGMLGCPAATGDGELPELKWQGERVVFGTALTDQVCAGTLAALDRGVAAVEAELGLEASAEVIAVRVLSDEQFDRYCPSVSEGGCAVRSTVHASADSFASVYLHELVHARHRQFAGAGKPLFSEGLASAIGGRSGGCLVNAECAQAELDAYLSATKSAALGLAGYDAGADLVHGMLGDHGPADTLEFLAGLDPDTTIEQVRARYQDRFGTALDDAFAAYRRGPLDAYTPGQIGCDAPAAPRAGAGVVLQATMDCGSPAVVNDFAAGDDAGFIEWTFVVEPEQTGTFVLTGSMVQSTQLSVRRCVAPGFQWEHLADQGPWTYATTLPRSDARPIVLGPGRHRVRWRHALDPSAALDLVLAPACTFEAQDCPEGQQCTIWNTCAGEVDAPALLGEPCVQAGDGPLACAAGSRCVGGVCTAECDPSVPCGPGQGCARVRVCGADCELVAQDCPAGSTCLPGSDPAANALGRGQCVAAGDGDFLAACDPSQAGCGPGLSCEFVRTRELPADAPCVDAAMEGCCVPLCDPGAAEPGCPDEVPYCDPIGDGPAGVCRTPY